MTNAAKKLQEAVPGDGHGASSVLQDSIQTLLGTVAEKALSSVSDKVSNTSGRLTDYAESGGEGGLLAALTGSEKTDDDESPDKSDTGGGWWEGAKQMVKDKASDVKEAVTGGGGGGSGKGKKLKLTNIVETIDVGVPVQLAYNQWTQFADFPSFMKKVERVEQESDEKLEWKAQIFLSHRTWEATILEQVPDERIVWRSKGAKGFIDGAVTFHEVTPDLTRIVLILEYHPKGLFEKTGNLWRAQGRRARLELKHFARHVMTQAVLHPDEVEGWRGEIRDGQVVEQEEDEAQPEESEDLEEEETDESEGEEPEGEEPEGDEAEETNEDDTEETDEDAGEQTDEDEEAPPPRRRGRPRKTAAAAEDQAPKRRGRPRKTAAKTAGSRQGARR
ncbi:MULTISPECIES: SRPBCC family protein [Rhodococcus]|uniref:SRPBCC family protein n=2 Tax=Rhodococcus opacus TaxID=37919 RepID=A0AAX3Y7J9_RHOOP|nr:SRPBCC family protein [Rhodococcus opacus]NHU48839.1 SRPBCC family protein [Rhodococcus sp. A14]MCZ4587088.1 SRPBCC family protein [Rhodococcus opacus]MDV6244595.1 SRPBCC family protein [Rhodococcus opacus]QZS56482.1 SRPBCC family protein [Rhodococcus opacus]RKM76890.1 cyclase [Rhodococcus opacus]